MTSLGVELNRFRTSSNVTIANPRVMITRAAHPRKVRRCVCTALKNMQQNLARRKIKGKPTFARTAKLLTIMRDTKVVRLCKNTWRTSQKTGSVPPVREHQLLLDKKQGIRHHRSCIGTESGRALPDRNLVARR